MNQGWYVKGLQSSIKKKDRIFSYYYSTCKNEIFGMIFICIVLSNIRLAWNKISHIATNNWKDLYVWGAYSNKIGNIFIKGYCEQERSFEV